VTAEYCPPPHSLISLWCVTCRGELLLVELDANTAIDAARELARRYKFRAWLIGVTGRIPIVLERRRTPRP
jgi:hypothetical protein